MIVNFMNMFSRKVEGTWYAAIFYLDELGTHEGEISNHSTFNMGICCAKNSNNDAYTNVISDSSFSWGG